VASHTARHTSAFASTPRTKTTPKDRLAFVAAMPSAVPPTALSACVHHRARYTIATTESAPTRLPTYTMPQLRSSLVNVMCRLIQLIITRLLPVNSSAPATTTSIRPIENPMPDSHLVMP